MILKLVTLSLIIFVGVATAHAQRNRDLKHAADDIRAARTLPDYAPPPTERCDLNSETCKPKNAQELSRGCGRLGVIASVSTVTIRRRLRAAGNSAFGPGDAHERDDQGNCPRVMRARLAMAVVALGGLAVWRFHPARPNDHVSTAVRTRAARSAHALAKAS